MLEALCRCVSVVLLEVCLNWSKHQRQYFHQVLKRWTQWFEYEDVQVAGFLWCSFSSDVSHFRKCFPLSLRVSFLVVLFSMPVGVLQVISALCLQSCRRRQDITWYYLCCCSSHLVSGSCLCHNQCVPHGGGLPQCREHVRCICSISARFIWAPPAHEETEDQALSDGELLGSVDASPPRFGWLAKNDKYARGKICQMSGTEMQNESKCQLKNANLHSFPHCNV